MLQEVRLLRIQEIGNVNITMDATDSVDLKKVLQETREQYEALVIKNKLELEKWFQSKVRWESLEISKITQNEKYDEKDLQTAMSRDLLYICVSVCKKVEIFEKDIHIYTTEVNTFTTQLSELKRTYQGLEITRESIFTEVGHRRNERMQKQAFAV